MKIKPKRVIIFLLISIGTVGVIPSFLALINHYRSNQPANNPYVSQTITSRSTDTIKNPDKKNWNAPTGGEILYAENLPSCQGTKLFNSPPAVDGTYNNISPIGHTSSYNGNPGHVFPVDHMSFDLKHIIPNDLKSPSLPATILAPADIEIYQVSNNTYEKGGKVVGNDYAVFFAPCREVTLYYGHVTNISFRVQNALDHADQKSCGQVINTGGQDSPIIKPCTYSVLLRIKSGEEIGTAGGSNIITTAFDFGVYDQRIQQLQFIDPKYWTAMNLHSVCGLYYYPDGALKTSLLNKINNTKKDTNGFPDCGTNMWDMAGTAQGNWVLPNTPSGNRVPDMQGFAVIHLYFDPSQGLIDWGGSIAPANRIQFKITNSGVINRDPVDIKADGAVYCFQDTTHGSSNAQSVRLQLIDNNTLKAEYLKGVCQSLPVLSNPTTYVR